MVAKQSAYPKVQPGQMVQYVSTKGYIKPALVVNTAETVVPGKAIPELGEGQVHLVVFSLTNGVSPRLSVPFEGLVKDNSDFQNEIGETVGVWR
jgi:hypothetical protein